MRKEKPEEHEPLVLIKIGKKPPAPQQLTYPKSSNSFKFNPSNQAKIDEALNKYNVPATADAKKVLMHLSDKYNVDPELVLEIIKQNLDLLEEKETNSLKKKVEWFDEEIAKCNREIVQLENSIVKLDEMSKNDKKFVDKIGTFAQKFFMKLPIIGYEWELANWKKSKTDLIAERERQERIKGIVEDVYEMLYEKNSSEQNGANAIVDGLKILIKK